jgi:hypothetical protein
MPDPAWRRPRRLQNLTKVRRQPLATGGARTEIGGSVAEQRTFAVRIWISSLCFALALAGSAAAQQQQPIRFTQLHDALHLTVQQEDAWRTFQAAITPTQGAESRRRVTQQMLPTLTTPRRVALIQAATEQDLADLRRVGDATITFYNRLTPDQQKVFDRQTAPAAEGADQD